MDYRFSSWILGATGGILLWCAPPPASAQDLCAPSEATDPQPQHINGAKTFTYKTIGDVELRLYVFNSAAHEPGYKAPAVVFFYGGGFLFGDIRRYQTQATHLALRGLVTVLVDYRVKCRHGSTIMDSVTDGKSAMRWVRGHADEFGIDPARIAAVGSSAGGLMAAATALDMASPVAIQHLATHWGKAVADRAHDFSPMEHLDRGLPPTIIFQGTADKGVSPASAEDFCRRARAPKTQCEVVLYPGAPHGFTEIWLGLEDPSVFPKTEFWASDTSRRTDAFLTKLGWLPPR